MSGLKVGIVSSILHPKYGGPAAVVRSHVTALADRAAVRVVGVAQPGEEAGIRNVLPTAELYRGGRPRRWFMAPGLQDALRRLAREVDVLHVHMLWDYAVWAGARAAASAGRPLIITPHGSVSAPWRYRAPHKRIYRRLFLRPVLRNLRFVHALSPIEKSACERFGVPCPVRVIPNGVPSEDFVRPRNPGLVEARWPQLRGRRIMLYLGRLWSEKGLDVLPIAWRSVTAEPGSRWVLVIAGPDYRGYRMTLERRLQALGLQQNTLLTGPLSGDLKDSLLGAAECLVLPSRSEAFSLALVEAMAAGLPAIYTTGCNFPELAARRGGWEVPASIAELSNALQLAMKCDPATLTNMGHQGRELALQHFTLEGVGASLLEMYHAALQTRAATPDDVPTLRRTAPSIAELISE